MYDLDWSHPPGSNRRPADYESAALPTELGWLWLLSLTGTWPLLEVLTMDPFDRFLQERTYLKGVSPETLRYYRWVRRAFLPILANPTKAGMMECIQTLLADGVSATSVNTYLRGLKAYIRWMHDEGLLKELFRVQFLKTEQKILATLSRNDVKRVILHRPTGQNE